MNLPNFETARILVFGDVMLDRYWYGDTTRISPEAPVPVVSVNSVQSRPGGAANVAVNVAALGGEVSLFGIVGDDAEAQVLRDALQQKNVHCEFHVAPSWPTATKLRVLGQSQQLLRMDFEKDFSDIDCSALIESYRQQLSQVHAVILSDYAKGTLASVEILIQLAREQGVPVLVDPKMKNFSRYAGASLVTPNRKEFESVVGPCEDLGEITEKATELLVSAGIEALLVTLGKEGMLLVQQDQAPIHLPTKAREVFDVTGAGDTVISVFATALGSGCDLIDAATLANISAGIVVGKLGAETVTVPELRRAIQRQSDSQLGILSEEELLLAVSDARAHDETVVMTNGCFDVLHAGHVQYLEQAKALGKRLIVAVNDDDSVRRLKGSERPFNTVEDRMAVLSALRVVDWVVRFSEDTPLRLIEAVLPDCLVKGGDYQVTEIAGHEAVLENGGEVKIVDLKPGCSTTGLVDRIKELV